MTILVDRISESDYQKVSSVLSKPSTNSSNANIDANNEAKLVLELQNADVVPLCFNPMRQQDEKILPGKTRVTDIWDRGFQISSKTWFSNQPLTIPYFLIAIVFLLGFEWSLRKYFRLA